MDVVATEIKKLGGALHMETVAGQGTRFTIRLPFTLAISHALVVRTGRDELYALPLPTVEGVVPLPRAEVAAHLSARAREPPVDHGQKLSVAAASAMFVGLAAAAAGAGVTRIPVVLVRAGEHSTGLVTDELIGSREIVVKPVGPQISGDPRRLGRHDPRRWPHRGHHPRHRRAGARRLARRAGSTVVRDRPTRQPLALVVDDSITVRRVTQRLLERNGMRVLTARDGWMRWRAAGAHAGHHPARHRDAAHGRLRGRAQVRNDPRTRDTCRSS
jgi:chemosensory pili system protein ChpA (sensor histidine kinase/response regulator)